MVSGLGVLDITVWRQRDSMTVHLVNLTNPMMMKGPVRQIIPLTNQSVRVKLPDKTKAKAVHLLVAGKSAPYRSPATTSTWNCSPLGYMRLWPSISVDRCEISFGSALMKISVWACRPFWAISIASLAHVEAQFLIVDGRHFDSHPTANANGVKRLKNLSGDALISAGWEPGSTAATPPRVHRRDDCLRTSQTPCHAQKRRRTIVRA